jgi:hypothetical protein
MSDLFRRAALPLGWYYVVTLALPLANGAAESGAAFGNHALAVLVVPPILIVCACALRKVARQGIGTLQRAAPPGDPSARTLPLGSVSGDVLPTGR